MTTRSGNFGKTEKTFVIVGALLALLVMPALALPVSGAFVGSADVTPKTVVGTTNYVGDSVMFFAPAIPSPGATIVACQYEFDENGGWGLAGYDPSTGMCYVNVPSPIGHTSLKFSAIDSLGEKPIGASVAFVYDVDAPTTTPAGNGGSYSFGNPTNSDVSVTLSCSDSGAGCAGTFYSLDGETFSQYTGAVSFSSEGTHTIHFYSADALGKVEEVKTATIIIDKAAPTVLGVDVEESDGFYRKGQTLHVKVKFSEAVNVIPYNFWGCNYWGDRCWDDYRYPVITMQLNGKTRELVYSSGSGTDTLVFNYAISDGENTTDLDYSSSSALLYNNKNPDLATVFDLAGNSANLGLASPGAEGSISLNREVAVDGDFRATVVSVTSPNDDGQYVYGETIDVTVTFSEAVSVSPYGWYTCGMWRCSPTYYEYPKMNLSVVPFDSSDSGGRLIGYVSGSGTDTLTFRYSVGSQDASDDLGYSGVEALLHNSRDPSQPTIFDQFGIPANLALPAPGALGALDYSKDISVDGSTPVTTATIVLNGETEVESGTYANADNATVTLSCTDTGTGCDTIYYYATGYDIEPATTAYLMYQGPLTFSSEGTHTVQFYSVDGAGNTEGTKSATITLDRTAPEMSANLLSDNYNQSFAGRSNTVYSYTYPNEDLGAISVEIAGKPTYTSDYGAYYYSYVQMGPMDSEGLLSLAVNMTDLAGNKAELFGTTDGTFVYFDPKPSEVFVSKEYCISEAEETIDPWPTQFCTVQEGLNGVSRTGTVRITDSENYNESVVVSKPVSIYGTSGYNSVSAQDVEGSLSTTVASIEFDSDGVYTSGVSTPLAIVSGNGKVANAFEAVSESGKIELKDGTWEHSGSIDVSKAIEVSGKGIGNSTVRLSCGRFNIIADGVSFTGVSTEYYSGECGYPQYGFYLTGSNFTLEDSSVNGAINGIYTDKVYGEYNVLTVKGSELHGTFDPSECYDNYAVGSQSDGGICEQGYGIYSQSDVLDVNGSFVEDFSRGIYHYSNGGYGEPTSLEYEEGFPSKTSIVGTEVAVLSDAKYYDSYGIDSYSDETEVRDSNASGFRYAMYLRRGAVSVTGSNATMETGNNYDCYSTYGISAFGETNELSGISVVGYTYAVRIEGSESVIEDFDLFGKPNDAENSCYPGRGIYSESAGKVTIRNGKIGNFASGIDIEGYGRGPSSASARIEGNSISANREVDYEDTSVTVENIEISGGDWGYYYYDSASAQGDDDDSGGYYDSDYGIRSDYQDNLTITECTIERFNHGIYARGGKNLLISGNTVRDNGGLNDDKSGIDLMGVESGRVYDNDITGNNYGVYSENSKAVVELNRITESRDLAADAYGKAANMTRNWWGTAAFEEILEIVSRKVDFSFWCLDSSCTTFAEPIVLSEENATLLGLSERSAPAGGSGNVIGTISNQWYSQNIGFRFAKDGVLYKIVSGAIYSVDTDTGAETYLRPLVYPSGYSDANPYAVAVDPVDGKVYVALHTHEYYYYYYTYCRDMFATLDLETGALTYLGSTNTGYYGGYETLAFDSEGTLYGAANNYLYVVDKTTGYGTYVSTIGSHEAGVGSANGYSTYYYTYGMDFAEDGTLYASGYGQNGYVWGLYTIDKETGEVSWISETNSDNGYPGNQCYELVFSPEGKLYCYNYGGDNGPSLVEVKLSEGRVATFQYALGHGKSYAYPLYGTSISGSVSGSETDFGLLRSNAFSPSGLPSGQVALGSLAWGIAGETLTFDPATEVSVWLGTAFNGGSYSVYRSETGTGSWTQDGLVDTKCTVVGGYCTFETEKASYFAVTRAVASASAGSGGSAPMTCRPDFSLKAPSDVSVDGTYAEIPVTFSVTGTCPSYGQEFAISAPEGWLAAIGSSTGLIREGEEIVVLARLQMPQGQQGLVKVKAIVGGKAYTAETSVKSNPKKTVQESAPDEPETATTVAPVVTTTVAPAEPEGQGTQTGFFTGFFLGIQNLWNWLSGLFGGQ